MRTRPGDNCRNLVRSLYKTPKPNLWRWRSNLSLGSGRTADYAKPQPILNGADMPLVEVEEFGSPAPSDVAVREHLVGFAVIETRTRS